MKAVGFFSGVGGIELGFKQAGIDTIWANEFDGNAAKTYQLNHTHPLVVDDIRNIQSSDVPDADIILGGFPCQAFSIAGHRRGFGDARGDIFFELARIIEEKKPKIIFIENVKNLVGHDKGNTYRVISQTLGDAGYHIRKMVLNASEYGNIPQNRERIYIIGFLDKNHFNNFVEPEPIVLEKTIADIVDKNLLLDEKYYYRREKNGFYDELERVITKYDTLYQWRRIYVRENKSGVCPTLTANMGTGGHNVPLVLTKHGIRKLTPKECFLFQGFPDEFVLPEDMAQSHLYKQAGNSVVVPVIKRLAEKIIKATA